MTSPEPILQAADLVVRRGGRAVLQVERLQIREGEIVSLIGPNGAGKTTLLQTLAALLPIDGGRILFRGQPVRSDHNGLAYRRLQAMVFQEPLLFNTSVFDNVAAGLTLRGLEKSRIKALVELNLERFGISHLARRPARSISGGEAQRTSLARAMAIQPQILFLDEPFASLDPPSREALIEDLDQILRQAGTTAVMTTHDRSEALRMAHRMAVMQAGRILQTDVPSTVFERPADTFVAAFVGVDNLLPATVERAEENRLWLDMAGKRLLAPGAFRPGSQVTLCLRPEHVTISAAENGLNGAGPVNAFNGRIVKVTPLGHFSKVQIDCGFPLVAFSSQASCWPKGQTVQITIDPSHLHVIGRPGS